MMSEILPIAIGSFGGTVGFCYLLNAPRRVVLPAGVTGMIGFVLCDVLARYVGCSTMFSNFAATVVVTVICEILARMMRLPATVFLLTSLVTMVPGYSFYSAMLALVQDNGRLAAAQGMAAVQIVASIAVAAAITSVCFRTLASMRRKQG